MHQHAIFCKSFRDDFARLDILVKSVEQTNGSDMPMLVSVPGNDILLLKDSINLPDFVTVIADEDYTIEGEPFVYGWLQQQVCKLSVYRTEFSKSYIMIDSDSQVINRIDESIFHTNGLGNIVYSPLHTKFEPWNNNLLRAILDEAPQDRSVVRDGSLSKFSEELASIRAEERPDLHPNDRGAYIPRLFRAKGAATQPGQIFHDDILRRFDIFLSQNEMTFYDAIRLSPWEYNWYGYFAASLDDMQVVGVVSPIVHFASDDAIADARAKGITLDSLRRHFVAIQMAARHFDTLEF